MLEFLEVLLPILPPKQIDAFPSVAPPGEHVIVYTDASYSIRGHKGLGAVIILPGGKTLFTARKVPLWILRGLDRNHKTLISQLELLAVVTANLTFAKHLAKQRVLYFEDNTCALSAMIHGYSSKEDMARLANMYHIQNFNLEITAWHEWVPSKANIADIPSRIRFARNSTVDNWQELLDMGAEQVGMVLPTRAQWRSLARWQSEILKVREDTLPESESD